MTTAIDPARFEFGLDSFGEIATDGDHVFSDAETLRLIVEEAQLAESVGLDIFSVGEHYREGFVDSATPVLLAAAAQATSAIHLGTSVTVLSTQDPVRLYQEFATVDGISDLFDRLLVDPYRRATEELGTTAYPVGLHSPGSSPTPTPRPSACSTPATR